MNKSFIICMLLLSLPVVSSISAETAIAEGENFIRNNAGIVHLGIFVHDYSLKPLAVYQNDIYYRVVYEISSDFFGIKKTRGLMVEMKKEDGKIVRVYASKKKQESLLL